MNPLHLLLAAAAATVAAATPLAIVSGGTWTASDGSHLQAHGGGILKLGSTYYLVGENKTAHPGSDLFQSVSCYRSHDLASWEFVNDILRVDTTGAVPDLASGMIIERPKIVHNPATGKFVLWMHVDKPGYTYARAGVAVSDTVCGDYTWVASYAPLGAQSRDLTVYVDDDGAGYLLGEDRPTGLVIYRLSPDFLQIASEVYNFQEHIESPAVFKHDGVYYVLGSQLTGWATNDNYYSTATSLAGPWSALALFTPAGSKTFDSQSSYVQRVGSTWVYMGDRWMPNSVAGLGASSYVWLPLTLNATARALSLAWHDAWGLDANRGEVPLPAPRVYPVPTNATFLGRLEIANVTAAAASAPGKATLAIRYTNGAGRIKHAWVSVGAQSRRRVAFLPTLLTDPWNSPTANVSVLHGFGFGRRGQTVVLEAVEDEGEGKVVVEELRVY